MGQSLKLLKYGRTHTRYTTSISSEDYLLRDGRITWGCNDAVDTRAFGAAAWYGETTEATIPEDPRDINKASCSVR